MKCHSSAYRGLRVCCQGDKANKLLWQLCFDTCKGKQYKWYPFLFPLVPWNLKINCCYCRRWWCQYFFSCVPHWECKKCKYISSFGLQSFFSCSFDKHCLMRAKLPWILIAQSVTFALSYLSHDRRKLCLQLLIYKSNIVYLDFSFLLPLYVHVGEFCR